jgi:hypothetical protein
MAGEKKEEKGGKGGKGGPKGGSGLDPFETLMFWFLIFAILSGFIARFTKVFSGNVDYSFGAGIAHFLSGSFLTFLKLLSYGVSVFSFFGIVWSLGALAKLNMAQNALFNPLVSSTGGIVPDEKKNRRWERVMEHINSPSPNDWKFAILEADIILDDLLTAMSYKGETMADKLKNVEKSDFLTIDNAWEAHKVRNSVAHEGADFLITEREARRVIELFRSVFEEFHFI